MKIKSIILSVLILALYSCSTYTGLYYYGKYSHTLYEFKKEPSEEQLQIHIDELKNIIETSGEKNLRVPPGIYAELGYYYSQQEKFDDAIALYNLEAATYPESSKFMKTLIDTVSSMKNVN